MIKFLVLSFGGGLLHASIGYFLIMYHVLGGMDEEGADRVFETWFQPGVGVVRLVGWDLETREMWPVSLVNILVYSALTALIIWSWIRVKAKLTRASS